MNCVERYLERRIKLNDLYMESKFKEDSKVTQAEWDETSIKLKEIHLIYAKLQIIANITNSSNLAVYLTDSEKTVRELAELRYEELKLTQT